MKQIMLLTMIPFLSVGANRCERYTQYIDKHNPYEIFSNSDFSSNTVTIKGKSFSLSSYGGSVNYFKQTVLSVDEYKSVDKNGSSSTKFFKYSGYKRSGLWNEESCNLTFYYDGYVTVHDNEKVRDKKTGETKTVATYYYYEFDKDIAAKLYDHVYDIYAELYERVLEDETEEIEARAKLEEVHLYDVLDDITDMSPVIFSFRTYKNNRVIAASNYQDDGTIRNLIIMAKYDYDRYGSFNTSDSYLQISGKLGNGVSYNILVDERNEAMRLTLNTIARSGRVCSKEDYYAMKSDEVEEIFDEVVKLYNN